MNAAEIARNVADGQLSPGEVAEDALRRAEAWQPRTNAFSQLRPEATLEEARALADALARGREAGPLAGVPVAVKDLFDIAGWETTGCCAAYRGRIAGEDSEAVLRLRAAGAIVLGKTNQHELAAGATNVVSACGPTRNPWELERITGGSSGGSAAVVGSGVTPLAIGSDTGGSIRIPASFCGVWGLKPSYGSIPLSGAMPLSPSLDTGGPIATDPGDLAIAFEVLAGREATWGPAPGRTVAVLQGPSARTASDEVLAATDRVADALREAGVRLTETTVSGTDDALEVWDRVAWAEFAEAYPDLLGSEEVHSRTRGILDFGRKALAGIATARARMAEIRAAFLEALSEADALLLPATPTPAPLLGDRIVGVGGVGLDVRLGAPSVLTRPISLTGLPAVAFPSGTADGLPLGAQLVGRPNEEAVVLGLAAAFHATAGPAFRPPPLAG